MALIFNVNVVYVNNFQYLYAQSGSTLLLLLSLEELLRLLRLFKCGYFLTLNFIITYIDFGLRGVWKSFHSMLRDHGFYHGVGVEGTKKFAWKLQSLKSFQQLWKSEKVEQWLHGLVSDQVTFTVVRNNNQWCIKRHNRPRKIFHRYNGLSHTRWLCIAYKERRIWKGYLKWSNKEIYIIWLLWYTWSELEDIWNSSRIDEGARVHGAYYYHILFSFFAWWF